MTTLDEKRSSICSASITDEKMLDYLVHGHNTSTDDHNKTTDDTEYCASTEGYNTNTATKNDTGYYSCSNESLTHENGSYIPESVAFHNASKKTASSSVEEDSHVDYVINDDILAQSLPIQTVTSPVPCGYVTLENQYQSHTIEIKNKSQRDYIPDSTSNQYITSPVDVLVKETNENRKSLAVFEDDSISYTTAEIQPTSLPIHLVSVENYKNIHSPAMSEGEYIPYTAAKGQCHSSTATKLTENNCDEPQSCSTESNSVVSMNLTKHGASITDSFPHVTLNEEDTYHTMPLSDSQHSYTSTNKNGTNINSYIYDTSCINDVTPHSESNSDLDVCNSTTMKAHQDNYVDHNIDANQQSVFMQHKPSKSDSGSSIQDIIAAPNNAYS